MGRRILVQLVAIVVTGLLAILALAVPASGAQPNRITTYDSGSLSGGSTSRASVGWLPAVIVRDGNTLILDPRSSEALVRAGVPRSAGYVVDRTGHADVEARLIAQLLNSKLTSAGTDLP